MKKQSHQQSRQWCMVLSWKQFQKAKLLTGKPTSMTIGIFDGVHRGHQALIKRIVSYNAENVPVIVTFRKNHKTESGDIQSFRQKLAMFESLGVKIVVVIDFTEKFRRIDGIEFLEVLLKHGNIGFFAVGSDFCCGYQQKTDAAAVQGFFASHGIPVEIAPQIMEGSLPISSSRIRSALAQGDIALAEAMLGHNVLQNCPKYAKIQLRCTPEKSCPR